MRRLLFVLLACALVLAAGAEARKRDWRSLVRHCEAPGPDRRWWEGGWWANTGNGFYFGPQFSYGTWRENGGPRLREVEGRGVPMRSLPIGLIIRVAERTYRSQGRGAWPHCYRWL